MVQILGSRFAGVDLVFHAVQTGHQQRRKAQVRIHQRIGEARLYAPALGIGHMGNADGRRAVARRIRQLDGSLVTRNEALVAVGSRVGDGVERPGVLDDAADIVQRVVRQSGIAVARKQVLAVLPDRLVHMHARAVVAYQRLGHEGGGLAVGIGDVPHHVFQDLRPVCALHQRTELGADFVLTRTANFMVKDFHRNAEGLQNQRDFSAQILRAIDGRYRKIATLDGRTMAAVAAVDLLAAVPGRLVFVDLHKGARHIGAPGNVVENKELGFRTKKGGVAHSRGLEVRLGTFGNRARVAVVGLAVARFDHVATQKKGRLFKKWIDVGGVRVGH